MSYALKRPRRRSGRIALIVWLVSASTVLLCARPAPARAADGFPPPDCQCATCEEAVPVLLTLDADVSASSVVLRWSYAGDDAIDSFVLYRRQTQRDPAVDPDPAARIATLPAGATYRTSYTYDDRAAADNATLEYTIEAIDERGLRLGTARVEVTTGRFDRASGLRLDAPYPSPAPAMSIELELPARMAAHVAVYDVAGREVARLTDATLAPGRVRLTWTGATRDGGQAPAGVYFVRLVTTAGIRMQRFTLVR